MQTGYVSKNYPDFISKTVDILLAHLQPKNAQNIDIQCIYAVNLREKYRKLRTFAVQNF